MTPMRVEIEIAGLVGRSPHPIHLDSLIAHQLVRRELGLTPHPDAIAAVLAELPLKREEVGSDWVWAASSLDITWVAPPTQVSGVRAFRVPDIAGYLDVVAKKKVSSIIDTGRGEWKSEQFAVEVQQASRAIAYAVGDIDRVRELLSGVETIGARRRYMTAKVFSVSVVEDPAAQDLWQRRYLPADALVSARRREGAYRLPLFDRANQTVVADNCFSGG